MLKKITASSYLSDYTEKPTARVFVFFFESDGFQFTRGYPIVMKKSLEMSDFSTAMRSITQGTATFTLEIARYEEVPQMLAQKIIEAANK